MPKNGTHLKNKQNMTKKNPKNPRHPFSAVFKEHTETDRSQTEKLDESNPVNSTNPR